MAKADDVARDAYEAMHAGKVMRIHGIRNAMLAASTRISPRSVVRSVVAKLNE